MGRLDGVTANVLEPAEARRQAVGYWDGRTIGCLDPIVWSVFQLAPWSGGTR